MNTVKNHCKSDSIILVQFGHSYSILVFLPEADGGWLMYRSCLVRLFLFLQSDRIILLLAHLLEQFRACRCMQYFLFQTCILNTGQQLLFTLIQQCFFTLMAAFDQRWCTSVGPAAHIQKQKAGQLQPQNGQPQSTTSTERVTNAIAFVLWQSLGQQFSHHF